jgi:hypothetical protein
MQHFTEQQRNIDRIKKNNRYFIAKYGTILSLIISFAQVSHAQIIPVRLNRQASNQLKAVSQKASASAPDSSYSIQTIGSDPFIYSYDIPGNYNPDSVCFISFDYIAPNGLDNIQIYFGPPFNEANSIKISSLPATSAYKNFMINLKDITNQWNKPYTKLRFDLGKTADKQINIKNIYLRKPQANEIDYSYVYRNKAMVNYMSSSFTNKITAVSVNKNRVTIRGNIPGNPSNLYLCELPMFKEPTVTDSFFSASPINVNNGAFEIREDRFANINSTTYDRIFSRWAIALKNGANYQVQSFWHYAENIDDAGKQYLPEEKPASKKGLAGFFGSENAVQGLLDMGIQNVTVNLVLPAFVSLTPTSLSYNFNGQTYYFNPTAVSAFDKTFKACSNHNIFVSAILLIPRNLSEPLKSLFMYPNANAGLYSMANITSLAGMNYYAAVISFLAERYSRPDKEYGRITNWIVHNEVDNGYTWANAGKQQMEYYTELYDRDMRTVYYAVRQYNPFAKVFISLTHYWSTSAGAFSFPSRDMLETLINLCQKQGDYEWGIAFHPYAENTFDPKIWTEKDVSTDINKTKFITPENIELIDTWLRTRVHLYEGLKVRTLLFSEQGVNSKSYKPEDLTIQAAGVAYMWKKFSRLPSLEAFDYHREVDNLNEGGLMLGLWTAKQGTKGTSGDKKPSWNVFQKAGTSSEDSAFAFALPVIGVTSWSQTFNPLAGEIAPATVTFNVTNGSTPVDGVSVYFNGEMHKTINGKALFYNVASGIGNRSYRLEKDGRLLVPEKNIAIRKDEIITVNIPR